MVEANLQQAPIAVTEFLEGLFETLLKSYERIAAWGAHFVFISAQQVLGHRRGDRSGKQGRGQHSENHCFSEGHKEVTRPPGQQENGGKGDADRRVRRKSRRSSLLTAVAGDVH